MSDFFSCSSCGKDELPGVGVCGDHLGIGIEKVEAGINWIEGNPRAVRKLKTILNLKKIELQLLKAYQGREESKIRPLLESKEAVLASVCVQ